MAQRLEELVGVLKRRLRGHERVCDRHGTAMDHTHWDGVVPELAPYFSVYAMDRRGRGASGDGPAFSIEHEVEDVVAVVNHIGDPVLLMGQSYGAICALEAARRLLRQALLQIGPRHIHGIRKTSPSRSPSEHWKTGASQLVDTAGPTPGSPRVRARHRA